MKAKAKLISTIVAMCLVITLGVFGILAVKTLNMSVGGNITFSADGLSLEVSQGVFKTDDDAEYTNITTQSGKLQAFAIDTNTKLSDIQDKIDSWTNLELTLDSKGDAILHFSVTNKMTTPLYVYVATTLGTNTNNNMNLTVSPNGTQIGAGLTTNFEITFDIIDTSINAGLEGFNVSVDFRKESITKAQNKIDTTTGLETNEVDYYYIEMGTYNGEPVRWRYVADSNGTRYDGTTPVTSLSGYYVLETKVLILRNFLPDGKYFRDSSDSKYYHMTEGYTNIFARDYGLSDIRAYLTNTGAGGFMETLGITVDNEVYQLIKSRSISDLYSNIQTDGTAIDATNANYSLSLSGDKSIKGQSDKFWLMSQQETNTFFADNTSRIWGTGLSEGYWLRSPAASSTNDVYYVDASGSYCFYSVRSSYGVRPAFKI